MAVTPFTQHLWQVSAGIYDAIVKQPFNVELAAGTLDPDTFRFYIVQDSPYLVDFARARSSPPLLTGPSPRPTRRPRWHPNMLADG